MLEEHVQVPSEKPVEAAPGCAPNVSRGSESEPEPEPEQSFTQGGARKHMSLCPQVGGPQVVRSQCPG